MDNSIKSEDNIILAYPVTMLWVVEPAKKFLSDFQGRFQKGSVSKKEIFNVCWIHGWVLLH